MNEQRKDIRVDFDKDIKVETNNWTDFKAKGVDISLGGLKFNCEKRLTAGQSAKIFLERGLIFKEKIVLEGMSVFAWPVEKSYQIAVNFNNPSNKQIKQLLRFIEKVTGSPYPHN